MWDWSSGMQPGQQHLVAGCRRICLNRMYVIVLSARREEQRHTWQCNLPLVDGWHMLKANAAVQVSQTMTCCTSMGSRS